MTLTQFTPCNELSAYVQGYRIISSIEGSTNRVLPGTSVAMAFRLRGKISYFQNETLAPLPGAAISGLRKSVRLIRYEPGSSALIVQFKPTGAAAFFKIPLRELFESTQALDNFVSAREITRLEERMAEVVEDTERIRIVEQFLKDKLVAKDTDSLVNEAVTRIQHSQGSLRIAGLAKELCVSQDVFEKRFRKITGASPKQFSMIVRMSHIARGTVPPFLIDLAIENGYYDQAHFNKDFKMYTGLTPVNFFKTPSFW